MIYFENEKTNIPKVIWWYALVTGYKGSVNAEYCNMLYKEALHDFFEKYPEQLHNNVMFENISWTNNITEDDMRFFLGEIPILNK